MSEQGSFSHTNKKTKFFKVMSLTHTTCEYDIFQYLSRWVCVKYYNHPTHTLTSTQTNALAWFKALRRWQGIPRLKDKGSRGRMFTNIIRTIMTFDIQFWKVDRICFIHTHTYAQTDTYNSQCEWILMDFHMLLYVNGGKMCVFCFKDSCKE